MANWLPELTRIDDPVADDWWSYKLPDGSSRTSRVTVGRPATIPNDVNGDWYCPVLIEGRLPGVKPVFGVGPVDALMNAMKLVSDFFDEVGGAEPRAASRP